MVKKLINIIANEDIRICLNEMIACYAMKGISITIFGLEGTNVFLAASTISSDEIIFYLKQEIEESISYYNTSKFCKIRKNRENVARTEIHLLQQENKVIGYMVLEFAVFSHLLVEEEILNLFSVALRLYQSYRNTSYFGKIDIRTGAYGRDIFLEKLENLDLSKFHQLSIVGFSKLIQKLHVIGVEKADAMMKHASMLLKRNLGRGAEIYRYGESSLAILSIEEEDEFFIQLENVLVLLEEEYPEDDITIAITQIENNPFHSLFICDEAYRKNIGIKIVRKGEMYEEDI